MKRNLDKITEWFDIHLGWFFVNGRKHDEWYEYINEKYHEEKV
tara:strand:+ start:835 stop:963 length:129 start_codon:yes stop_codon:yes gene_type:complete